MDLYKPCMDMLLHDYETELLREDFDDIFRKLLFSVYDGTYDVRIVPIANKVLTDAGIDVLSKLSYIPNFLYFESDIKSLTIPDNITGIRHRAFSSSAIENIYIPNSVSEIYFQAFSYSKLKSIYLPPTISMIGIEAFAGCEQLEYVTLPKTLQTIEDRTFAGCPLLDTIIIPKSVKTIRSNFITGYKGGKIELFYEGSSEEWDKIALIDFNYNLYKVICMK